MKFLKILLIISVLAIFVFACTQSPNKNDTVKTDGKEVEKSPKATATVDELALGRKTYKETCVRCHKEDGTGGEVEIEGKKIKADDLTSDKMKKMTDAKYIKYITDGIPDEGMPSFKDVLNDGEIKEVVKFIRKEIQK